MVVGIAFLAFVVVYVPWQMLGRTKAPPQPAPLSISGAATETLGMLDPSLAFDSASQTVWMAYTAEEKATTDTAAPSTIRVRLANARAPDCTNWSSSSPEAGFPSKSDDLMSADGTKVFRSGVWRAETPSIVYDPGDKGREWKLFAYKYFWPTDSRHALEIAQHFGVIAYKYSSDPRQGWSQEQWLFAPGPGYPPPPYEQMVLLHLNRLHDSLKDVVTYARPSAIAKDGVLALTLSVFTGAETPDRVVMVVSRDHGKSWLYVGTPLRLSDIRALGPFTRLAGASMIEHDGKVYLAAVPGTDKQYGIGALIFEFADVARGFLKRDAKTGLPVVVNQIPMNNARTGILGGGAIAYTQACAEAGILMSEQAIGPSSFQIFKTYKPLLNK